MMILVSQHARRRGRSFSLPLLLSLLHERWKRRTRKQALMRARSPPWQASADARALSPFLWGLRHLLSII
jgi:hypothetical protein